MAARDRMNASAAVDDARVPFAVHVVDANIPEIKL